MADNSFSHRPHEVSTMTAAHDVEALLIKLGAPNKLRIVRKYGGPSQPLLLSLARPWKRSFPMEGSPAGSLSCRHRACTGGSTSMALLAAVRAGQERSGNAWCAWVDPERTLYAPGVVAAGVDLVRMLVVNAARAELGRAAVKLVGAGAFEVKVVIDFDAAIPHAEKRTGGEPRKRRAWPPEVLVRKLSHLSRESSGATVLLLTDALRHRATPWPVTLRLEMTRPSRTELSVRVAKDRRGRSGVAKIIPFRPLMRSMLCIAG